MNRIERIIQRIRDNNYFADGVGDARQAMSKWRGPSNVLTSGNSTPNTSRAGVIQRVMDYFGFGSQDEINWDYVESHMNSADRRGDSGSSRSNSGSRSGSDLLTGGQSDRQTASDEPENASEAASPQDEESETPERSIDPERVQRYLNNLGYDLEVDGNIGPKTEDAIRQWKESMGFDPEQPLSQQEYETLVSRGLFTRRGQQSRNSSGGGLLD